MSPIWLYFPTTFATEGWPIECECSGVFLRPDSLKTSHMCSPILPVSSVKMKLIWDSETWESCVEDGRVSVSLSPPHKTVHPPGQLCQAARNELFWNKIHNAFLVSATAGYITRLFLTMRNSNNSTRTKQPDVSQRISLSVSAQWSSTVGLPSNNHLLPG